MNDCPICRFLDGGPLGRPPKLLSLDNPSPKPLFCDSCKANEELTRRYLNAYNWPCSVAWLWVSELVFVLNFVHSVWGGARWWLLAPLSLTLVYPLVFGFLLKRRVSPLSHGRLRYELFLLKLGE